MSAMDILRCTIATLFSSSSSSAASASASFSFLPIFLLHLLSLRTSAQDADFLYPPFNIANLNFEENDIVNVSWVSVYENPVLSTWCDPNNTKQADLQVNGSSSFVNILINLPQNLCHFELSDSANPRYADSGAFWVYPQNRAPVTWNLDGSGTSFTASASTSLVSTNSANATRTISQSSAAGSLAATTTSRPTPTVTSTPHPSSSSRLSTGAKAGIGVGVGLAVIAVIAFGVRIIYERRQRRRERNVDGESTNIKLTPTSAGPHVPEIPGNPRAELETSLQKDNAPQPGRDEALPRSELPG